MNGFISLSDLKMILFAGLIILGHYFTQRQTIVEPSRDFEEYLKNEIREREIIIKERDEAIKHRDKRITLRDTEIKRLENEKNDIINLIPTLSRSQRDSLRATLNPR